MNIMQITGINDKRMCNRNVMKKGQSSNIGDKLQDYTRILNHTHREYLIWVINTLEITNLSGMATITVIEYTNQTIQSIYMISMEKIQKFRKTLA